MALESQGWCPQCEAETGRWRMASTRVHLGEKIKWVCTECDFGIVTIDETIDTGVAPSE